MTGLSFSRRRVLGSGAAIGLAAATPARGASADDSARAAPPHRFVRGVNAWPWLAMPSPDPPPGTPYPAWPPYVPDRPVPSPADLRRLAASGLDFVRLVVDPAPFLNAAAVRAAGGGSAQRSALAPILRDAVLRAAAAGLGVVVNLQPGGSAHWTGERLYGRGADDADFRAYRALVAAFAGQLGALDRLGAARLAFEPVNEPPQDAASADGARDWAAKLTALLRAARTAAPGLTLVATGASGGGPAGLRALDGRGLTAAYTPLLFTFHFYEPFLFSHQGAPWLAAAEPHYRWLNAVPWPGSTGDLARTMAAVEARMAADPHTAAPAKRAALDLTRSVMRDYFDAAVDARYVARFFAGVSDWAAGNGVPPGRILLGEFGALKSTTASLDTWDAPPQSVTGGPYVAAEPAARARYLADVRAAAERSGFGWAMWTLFNPGMGLMDEATRALDPAVASALGLDAG